MFKLLMALSFFLIPQAFSQEVYGLDEDDKPPLCYYKGHLWVPIYLNHADECKCTQKCNYQENNTGICNARFDPGMGIFVINPKD